MSKRDQEKGQAPDSIPLEQQARDQTGQQRIKVHIDEKNLKVGYANCVRPIGTAEEVILDFGLNLLLPTSRQKAEREILFQANERIILNYYAAKRLAVTLGQLVQRYESEYGQIELNSARRRKGRGG
jgi:hypothetical protein